jgi:hypothetical protein
MSTTSYASALFASARRTGRLGQVWAKLRGQSMRLLDLHTVAANGSVGDRRAAGIQTVAIGQIRGSEGRCEDFDSKFRPLKQHAEERWVSVARAQLRGIGLPAVELIQVGEVYFVRDGHHRISVGAALGQQEIDAIVTVWHVAEPVPQESAVVQQPQQHRSRALLPRLMLRFADHA